MTAKYTVGQTVQLSAAGRDNENYADVPMTICAVYDHYTPAANMANDPTGHPGYDADLGEPLYEFDGINYALYEYEIEAA